MSLVVTKPYDRLRTAPGTGIDRGELAPMERAELRSLQVTRSSDSPSAYDGHLTTVYYLAGDVRAAAAEFVEQNREQLEQIDFSTPDPIQSSIDRDAYDWILHFLGERELRRYRTVVYERRPSGREWVIDRECFEEYPENRYRTDSEGAKVSAEIDVDELYTEFDGRISAADLEDHEAVSGSPRYVLEYYRVAGAFDCVPVDESTPVLEKH